MPKSLNGELQVKVGGGVTHDMQKAANLWAGTSGKDLLAALNVKAGTTGKEMAHVCRLLGLPEGP